MESAGWVHGECRVVGECRVGGEYSGDGTLSASEVPSPLNRKHPLCPQLS